MITLSKIFKSESQFYFFFTPRKPFPARKRTNFDKTEVVSLSFFSCRTDENQFQPEREQIHFKPLSIRF